MKELASIGHLNTPWLLRNRAAPRPRATSCLAVNALHAHQTSPRRSLHRVPQRGHERGRGVRPGDPFDDERVGLILEVKPVAAIASPSDL